MIVVVAFFWCKQKILKLEELKILRENDERRMSNNQALQQLKHLKY